MASVLLVHPFFLADAPEERELSSPYFPLGLLYLAAYLRERGHRVSVFDGTFQPGPAAFAEALTNEAPDVVGVSAVSTTRDQALGLAAMAAATDAVVLLGGPDPTLAPEFYLADASVDLVVHHEGEQTTAAVLDRFDAGELTIESLADEPGIAFRRDGQPIINQPRPPIENLDELPLPARDLIDMDRYLKDWQDNHGYSSITVATSRGCPFGCAWCRDSVHGDGFRQRSPESVAAEVKALSERYDVERLRLIDDVDGIKRDWFDQWADASPSDAVPFEPLHVSAREDLPLLDVRDSL